MGADLCDEDGLFWMDYNEIVNDFESINICMLHAPGLSGPLLPATANNRNLKPWSKSRYCFHFEVEDSEYKKAGTSSDKWGDMSKCKSEKQVGDMLELTQGKTSKAEPETETELLSEDMVTAKNRDSEVENIHNENENEEELKMEKGEKEEEEGKYKEEEIMGGQEQVMEDSPGTLSVTAPIYLLTLLELCDSMYMSVLQPRSAFSDTCIDVRLSVLKYVHGSPPQYILIATTSLNEMQGQSDKMSLDAGQYFIIVTSTGCHMRQYMADLCVLSIPTCPHRTKQNSRTEGSIPGVCRSSSSILRGGAEVVELFAPSIAAAYSHLFHRLDIDNDSHLSRSELEGFICLLEGKYVLSDDMYKWFLNTFDSTSRGLTEKGFLDLQFQTFKGHNYSSGTGSGSAGASDKGDREREREGILLELHGLGYRPTRICSSARHSILTAVEEVEMDVEVGVDEDTEGADEVLQMSSSVRSIQEESKRVKEAMKETMTDKMTERGAVEEGEKGCEHCHTLKNKVEPSTSHRGWTDQQRNDKSSSSSSSSSASSSFCCTCTSTLCTCELMYVTGSAAVITLHTSVEHDLRACQPNSTLASIATELVVMTQGKASVLQCCTLYVHTYSESHQGTGGATFLVVNTSNETLQFRLDCSDSTNMCSGTGKLICTNTLVRGARKIILHLRYALKSP